MKECICYNIEKLLQLLPGFQLKAISVVHEDEDDSQYSTEHYLTSRDNIERIEYYHSLGTSISVKYSDNSAESLFGRNFSIAGQLTPQMGQNYFLSPRVNVNADYVEATSDLLAWLQYNGVEEEALSEISDTLAVYEIVDYPGVPTPFKRREHWVYSSEDLRLEEREIQTALASIEDELLRRKIECILYARVFKRHY